MNERGWSIALLVVFEVVAVLVVQNVQELAQQVLGLEVQPNSTVLF